MTTDRDRNLPNLPPLQEEKWGFKSRADKKKKKKKTKHVTIIKMGVWL